MTPFADRLAAAVSRLGAPLAVGLDPHLERLPAPLRARFAGRSGAAWRQAAAEAVAEFDRVALDALAGQVAAIKPQFAFYEQLGSPGWAALEAATAGARERGLLVIGDGKRGDIASTAAAYATAALDPDGPLGCDALTVNPWMGFDTLEPFLAQCRRHGRGLFVLVRTTNPGSADLQRQGEPTAALRVAAALHRLGEALMGDSGTSGLGAVVGASVPAAEAATLRAAMPAAWFLVPGLGAQGGTPAMALAGRRTDGLGCLPVASRAVLFPSAPDPSYDAEPGAWIRQRAQDLRAAVGAAWGPEGAQPGNQG